MKGKQLNTNGVMSPCKNCTKRHTACHDDCKDFDEYKLKIQEIKNKRKAYADLFSYNLDCRHLPEYTRLRKKK